MVAMFAINVNGSLSLAAPSTTGWCNFFFHFNLISGMLFNQK
jgi:hypothetical protein